MTDLEICKRIAEIEGLSNHIYFHKVQVDRTPNKSINTSWITWEDYNPLTDDALCFQLMVKHKLEVWEHEGKWLVGYNLRNTIHNESPNKAICLAIIEANNEAK